MEARDPDTGEAMTETLLRDESITMFFAGHETTARTMAAAWYALGTHPEVAARLHEELDSALKDQAPTLEELHHLPYTLQVVKEVLRLYPAAPFYARDAIEDDQIGGFDVPAGATIMLSPFHTHRHPDFWTDPDRFHPDRWTRDAETTRHGHSYHPFRSRPPGLHRQQLLAAREPPAARDPRATLPPAPARWVRTAPRDARHAEHRGRPTRRDRDAVIGCFVGAAARVRRDIRAAFGAAVIAVIGYGHQRRAERRTERATLYGHAIAAVEDYLEGPYRIMRRDDSAESRFAITNAISDSKTAISLHQALPLGKAHDRSASDAARAALIITMKADLGSFD
jgi:hypothetical protein